jgi:hypothetical protein
LIEPFGSRTLTAFSPQADKIDPSLSDAIRERHQFRKWSLKRTLAKRFPCEDHWGELAMHGHYIVGVFETRDAAEQARWKLKSAGVKEQDIQLSQDGAGAPAEGQSEGFFEWLFGGDSPSRDRDWYRSNLTGGRTAVSILAAENQDRIWLSEQLVQAGALDLVEEGDTGARNAGGGRRQR